MSEHTKGPWTVGNDGYNANTIYAGDTGVCQMYGVPINAGVPEVGERYSVGMANARLIAAAPELLEALEDIISSLETTWRKDQAASPFDIQQEMVFARTIIAKAKAARTAHMNNTQTGASHEETTTTQSKEKAAHVGKLLPSSIDLRDYFAGQALAGMSALSEDAWKYPQIAASDAYAIADAMLKAREVKS